MGEEEIRIIIENSLERGETLKEIIKSLIQAGYSREKVFDVANEFLVRKKEIVQEISEKEEGKEEVGRKERKEGVKKEINKEIEEKLAKPQLSELRKIEMPKPILPKPPQAPKTLKKERYKKEKEKEGKIEGKIEKIKEKEEVKKIKSNKRKSILKFFEFFILLLIIYSNVLVFIKKFYIWSIFLFPCFITLILAIIFSNKKSKKILGILSAIPLLSLISFIAYLKIKNKNFDMLLKFIMFNKKNLYAFEFLIASCILTALVLLGKLGIIILKEIKRKRRVVI